METSSMSKIVDIYRTDKSGGAAEDPVQIGPRQLAIEAGKITMIVEFVYLVLDSRQGLKGRELKNFMSKFESLDRGELLEALQVPEEEFMRILNQVVECIGCRRIIERVFRQFKKNGSSTLDPIHITQDGVVQIRPEHLEGETPLDLCKLLQKSVFLYSGLLTYKQRSKQSIRCTIHNLDAYKVTPFSDVWTQIWVSMKGQCREKILVIEMADLQTTLDVYLKKHKFCHECSAKVETAFHLLFKEKNPKKEPGYSEELYAGIKRCLNKHIQLPCKVDFLDMLIRRAEPELVGNGNRQRERHAKTLEIAQEEVLTCIGMCIFERFRRIYNCRKEEEGACQLLAVLALHGMYRSFDLAVEQKRGISNLELLYEEISQQEQRQELKREQKRLKKRQKKMEKRSLCTNCKIKHSHVAVEGEEEEDEPLNDDKGIDHHHHHDQEEEDEDDDGDFEEEMIKVARKNARSKLGKQQQSSHHQNNRTAAANSNKQSKPQKQLKEKLISKGGQPKAQPTHRTQPVVKEQTPECDHDEEEEDDEEVEDCVCHTCEVGHDSIVKRSQPISVDCGYVSDQLSLTNCSSTSSSSLDDGLMKRGIAEQVEPTSACAKSPESSGLAARSTSSPLTINSQLSSLTSSPEGSEVACQDGLCNHSHEEPQGSPVVKSAPPPQQQLAPNVTNNSYIPEELINEFRSRHSNLKEVREELRRNLRQNFAQFCLENKNRPLSHLCRTGRCVELAGGSLGDEVVCTGDCE